MQTKTISEIEEEYGLELEKIEKTITAENPKSVLLQFPDGMKPYSTTIVDYLQNKFKNINFLIWMGTCFGACDVPQVSEKQIDLIIQFGHSAWNYDKNSGIEVLN